MNNQMKALRALHNISQSDLAKRIGVSRQTINLIEQEKYNPSLKLCLAICYELDVKLDELFWKEKDNNER